ncbi:MAG: hydrogenase maturation nickel metallochaperone HypA [Calditrichaeota bacterium]|nr:hydrogenase maturation nickel metallochaperone HypA [Calditrichota bacterium]
MHELYLAEQIIKGVLAALPGEVSPASVRLIEVEVGRLNAVVPESLCFLFDALRSSYDMPKAQLTAAEIDVLCRCQDCAAEFKIDLPLFLCPECGGSRIDILRGRGVRLMRVEIEE